MNRPVLRIVAVPKDVSRRGGPTIEVATVWPSTRKDGTPMEGCFSFSPVTEDVEDPKYPKMNLLETITSGEYFLNVYPIGDTQIVTDDF